MFQLCACRLAETCQSPICKHMLSSVLFLEGAVSRCSPLLIFSLCRPVHDVCEARESDDDDDDEDYEIGRATSTQDLKRAFWPLAS